MSSSAPRWRKGSVFACTFRPLDRNDIARLLFLAEALDRRTHRPGRHGGIIGRTGLAVLRALACRFFNKASGRLDPSIQAIAEAANVAKSTVQEALKRLELAGLIERVRRIARVRVMELCPVTGNHAERIRVVQTTNGYLLNVPLPDRRTDDLSQRKPPRLSSDTGSRGAEPNPALAEALERFRRAYEARRATA